MCFLFNTNSPLFVILSKHDGIESIGGTYLILTDGLILISPATHESTRSGLSFYWFEERLIVAEGSWILQHLPVCWQWPKQKRIFGGSFRSLFGLQLHLFHVFRIQWMYTHTPTCTLRRNQVTKGRRRFGCHSLIIGQSTLRMQTKDCMFESTKKMPE